MTKILTYGSPLPCLMLLVSIAACTTPEAADLRAPPPITGSRLLVPPGAPEGSCWHRNISPAVIETITEQDILTPEQTNSNGEVIAPATYRTVTRQKIVTPRRISWIETPCPEDLTVEFVSSLQRALAARAYYSGGITGEMDQSTRIALRRFQKEEGLDSSALSLATARRLGLIAIVH